LQLGSQYPSTQGADSGQVMQASPPSPHRLGVFELHTPFKMHPSQQEPALHTPGLL
jgi:hypothetical protein